MQQYNFPGRSRIPVRLESRMVYYIVAIIALLWIGSGIYIVDPDEQGVIRKFGKWIDVTGPGIHYHLPSPIETVDKPKVTKVRRIEIGFRTIHPGPPPRYRNIPKEALMLTGDENIVDVEIIVQYRIKDAADYLFNVRDPEGMVRDASEAALRQVVGRHKIDEVLTEGKLQVQVETKEKLQEIFNLYKSGLIVDFVQLQGVQAPKQVDHAFKDVASAREDKERLIKEADGYRNDIIPKARGQAAKLVKEAEAYKVERTKRAQGDVERFLQVLKEYRKARRVTETRLYLETMEKILPGLQKYVVQSDKQGGLLNVLPLQRGIVKGGSEQ